MASPTTAARPPAARRTSTTAGATSRSSPTPPASTRASPTPVSPSIARSSPSVRGSTTPSRPSSLSTSVSARRAAPPIKSPTREKGPHPDDMLPADGNDALLLSLRRETEEKEELLVKIQNKDQQIETLQSENDSLSSALNAAEARLAESFADQERFESEMEGRLEVIEKLRSQVRELEKEKRDIQRRYNDQTATFDAERQSYYDNEQHLKSRIQHLSQARKTAGAPAPEPIAGAETDVEDEEENPAPQPQEQPSGESDEPPEMTALRLELNTLSVSHSSIHNTLQLLQSQLLDLNRVNHELQEENESYNILLRERTLTGQFDPMRYAGSGAPSSIGMDDDDDTRSTRSGAQRSLLDRVPEEADEELSMQSPAAPGSLADELMGQDGDRLSIPGRRSKRGRTSSPPPRGENLGDLPITGPGLDLASELGRAQNKDISEGLAPVDDKFAKKGHARDATEDQSDVTALRNEVKALKDANKALSLYASKILDRIISEEGFEHVLAVDYGDKPSSPRKIGGSATSSVPPTPSKTSKKPRPQSTSFFAKALAPTPEPEKIPQNVAPMVSPPAPAAEAKRNRRSLSFDWKSFSLFGGDKGAPPPPPPDAALPSAGLKPLTLRPGATSTVVGTARKLDTQEDDEDRRERERLHATMKLMGIDAPPSPATPMPGRIVTASSEPRSPSAPTPTTTTATTNTSRFPFFRSRSGTDAELSPQEQRPLTAAALEQAEAEQSLAALDARERAISAELAKGRGGSGFTEISPRSSLGDEWRSRRSRRSAGSGSTVFSAGMSRAGGDADSIRRMSEDA